MRRFLTPKWILSHLFVLGMVVLMVNLGFWQLRRLDERKARNAEVRAAMEAEPVPLQDLLGTGARDETSTLVRGEYLPEASFLVANRTHQGQPGSWLVTPVRLDDGRVVVVSRGWVPRLWVAGDDPRELDPPTGAVEVLGRLESSRSGGRIGEVDQRLPEINTLDLATVEDLLDLEVEDHWVQLVQQAPPLGDLPVPVPPPSLDEGPHLSYAFQWFFFSTGTVVVYAMILRRRAAEDDEEPVVDTDAAVA